MWDHNAPVKVWLTFVDHFFLAFYIVAFSRKCYLNFKDNAMGFMMSESLIAEKTLFFYDETLYKMCRLKKKKIFA